MTILHSACFYYLRVCTGCRYKIVKRFLIPRGGGSGGGGLLGWKAYTPARMVFPNPYHDRHKNVQTPTLTGTFLDVRMPILSGTLLKTISLVATLSSPPPPLGIRKHFTIFSNPYLFWHIFGCQNAYS